MDTVIARSQAIEKSVMTKEPSAALMRSGAG